jgi:hypothetical protein
VIDPAVENPPEHQPRAGVAGALDGRPTVVWIGLAQIRQIVVDGVGVDIDEARAGGSVSVDNGASVRDGKVTGKPPP